MRAPLTEPQAGTVPEAIHRRRWVVLAVLLLSLFVVVLDNSILNVAMKVIATPPPTGLGASQSQLEWAISSYTLVFAGLLFTAGLLGDRLGRKRVLLFGMVVFGLGSFLSAMAGSPGELIAFRAVMGFGGAFVMPATLAILMNVFERKEQPRAIGIWAGAVGMAIALGPITGGLLLERFWWGSVFLVNVPVVIAAVIAMAFVVPDSRDPAPGRIDPGGVLLSVAGLVLLVYGIIKGGQLADFTPPQVWGTALAGLALLAVFAVYESRLDHPALDVRWFRDPRFSAAVAAIGLVFFALMGVTFFMVFYLQSVRGYTPLESGLQLLPLAIALTVFSPRARFAVDRFGAKAVCTAALLLVGATFLGFLSLDRSSPVWLLSLLFLTQGIGMAHVATPATVSIMITLPREKAGAGSAVNNTFRQIGASLGVAVLGSLLSTVYRGRIEDHLAGVPGAGHAAGESIEATLAVANRLGPAGRALADQAENAFVHAMHITAVGSAAVAFLGAVVVAIFLPGLKEAGGKGGDGKEGGRRQRRALRQGTRARAH